MQKTELKSILQQGYVRQKWVSALQFLTGHTDKLTLFLEPRQITLSSQRAKQVVRFLRQLGSLQTGDGEVLPVFEVELLEGKTRIEYNKVGVNQLIKDFILQDARKGALVTYYYPNNSPKEWRFSFISKTGGSDFFEEVAGVETNPKKYTYIFGTEEEHRTAIERLLSLKASSLRLDDFFEAFNVEPVSNDFFKEYKQFYVDFVKSISGEEIVKKEWVKVDTPAPCFSTVFKEDPKEVRNFVKRLLGRLVFLYFLQKKKWLGAHSKNYDDGDTNFLQNLFNHPQTEAGTFYGDWLCKLFFDTLNNPERAEDAFVLPGGQAVWVPFLNGGLFEERQEPAGHKTITFPTFLFEHLFTFFNSYNFTIYENSPEDHTIAVDPEMLGNIFENLLEENNARGAFYTPKEIVHYMTQESLIEYLHTHLQKDRAALADLVKNQSRAAFDRNELKQVFEKIDTVKVCDPAIGSGAFPMGLLQEIFSLKSFLNFEEGFGVESPAVIKQNIIQNSIYGVDLEPGAVDIARLRFWLSLVVDEPTPKPLPNLDYKIMQGDSLRERFDGIDLSRVSSGSNLTIANAQTDIFGNLVDGQLGVTFDKAGTAEELQQLIQRYFTASVNEKPGLREGINRLVHEFIEFNIELREKQLHRFVAEVGGQKSRNSKIEKSLKTWASQLEALESSRARLHEIQNNDERPYFLWHLFFKDVFDQGGFDIVIGNPPYIQLQSMGDYSGQLKEEKYATYAATGDIYCLFYEKGFDLLNQNGTLTYITSNKWMRAGYGKTMRRYFLEKTNTLQLIDFGDARIFENATTYTNIYLGKSGKGNEAARVWNLSQRFKPGLTLLQNMELNHNYQPQFSEDSFILVDGNDLKVKRQIEKVGLPLKDWDVEINYGIKTGYNDAFIINKETKDRLIAEDPKNKEIIKPILRGRDIKKYKSDFADLWMIFIPWHFPLHETNVSGASVEAENQLRTEYPSLYRHLLKYENELRARNKSETGIRYEWYVLQRCAASYYAEFDKPKIVWAEIVYDAAFYYDEEGTYQEATGFLMTGESLKYLLALLNSKPVTYFFKKFYAGGDLRGGTFRYKKAFLENLPIPQVPKEEEVVFEVLVDCVMTLKKMSEDAHFEGGIPPSHISEYLEKVIDGCVFELYFGEHMHEQEIDILKRVNSVIRQVFKGDIELQPSTDHIQKLYDILSHPDNDVRNRILRFPLASPDILKPILKV